MTSLPTPIACANGHAIYRATCPACFTVSRQLDKDLAGAERRRESAYEAYVKATNVLTITKDRVAQWREQGVRP
jgi:hypothetical protein